MRLLKFYIRTVSPSAKWTIMTHIYMYTDLHHLWLAAVYIVWIISSWRNYDMGDISKTLPFQCASGSWRQHKMTQFPCQFMSVMISHIVTSPRKLASLQSSFIDSAMLNSLHWLHVGEVLSQAAQTQLMQLTIFFYRAHLLYTPPCRGLFSSVVTIDSTHARTFGGTIELEFMRNITGVFYNGSGNLGTELF